MKRPIALIIIALMMAATFGCGGTGGQVSTGTSTVKISIAGLKNAAARTGLSAQSASVANILFTISAPDMQTITRTVPVTGSDTITASFEVPNGSNRHFLAVALAADNTVLYQGDAFSDLNGTPMNIEILMGVDISGDWTVTHTVQNGQHTDFITYTQTGNSLTLSGDFIGSGTITGNSMQLSFTALKDCAAVTASGTVFSDGTTGGTFTATGTTSGGCQFFEGTFNGTWTAVRGHIVPPLVVLPATQTVDGSSGGTASFTISGGSAPYTVSSDNPSFPPSPATVTASGGSFTVAVPAGTSVATAVTYTIQDNAGVNVTALLNITVASPPISVTGTWELHFRCADATTDASVIDVSLNEATGGSFTGNGSGTDYNGTPLTMAIAGSYASSTHLITGTVTTTFQGNACVREDTFSTTLQSNDTGYINMTQTQVCGCSGQVRMIKLN